MLRLFTQRRILAALTAALLIGSLLGPGSVNWIAARPQQALQTVVGYPSAPLKALSDAIRGRAPLAIDRGQQVPWERLYNQLARENAQLRQDRDQAHEELRNYLRLNRSHRLEGVTLRLATVTSWSTSAGRRVLTLAAGTRDGLAPGLAVADIDNVHLIGHLTTAGPAISTVELITSPRRRLEVRILPTVPTALGRELLAFIESDRSGRVFTAVVKADAAVQPGDLAHLRDPAWPTSAQGLVVGEVTQVRPWPDDPYNYRQVVVQPVPSLANLNQVVILIPQEH